MADSMFKEKEYARVKDLIVKLSAVPSLRGKLHIAGGTVPYLLSGRDSGRTHGDIDIMVKKEDMPAIRDFLVKSGLYQPENDSLNLEGKKDDIDYGVSLVSDGFPIEFYPYEEVYDKDGNYVGFNCYTYGLEKRWDGSLDLKQSMIHGLKAEDCFVTTNIDGVDVGTISPELNYVMKMAHKNNHRPKDIQDITVLENYVSMDMDKVGRIESCFKDDRTFRTLGNYQGNIKK